MTTEPAPQPPSPVDPVLPLAALTRPLDLPALFGGPAPVELEVGFGSGLFLAAEAQAHPERHYLGIERDLAQVRRTAEKIRRRGCPNVRLCHVDAFYFLEEFPPEGAFAAVHIYFSDPWPKTRHHKRRLFQPRLLPPLARIMAPGALLRVKTDVSAYHAVIRELLLGAPFLEPLMERRLDLEPLEGDTITNYQRKALEAGHPIHLLVLRRREP